MKLRVADDCGMRIGLVGGGVVRKRGGPAAGELSIGVRIEPLLPAMMAIGQLICGGTEEHRTLEKRHDSKARSRPRETPVVTGPDLSDQFDPAGWAMPESQS